jgi:hypothetical protein
LTSHCVILAASKPVYNLERVEHKAMGLQLRMLFGSPDLGSRIVVEDFQDGGTRR